MKNFLILAAGFFMGFLCSRMFGTIYSQPQNSTVNSVTKSDVMQPTAESNISLSELRRRSGPTATEQAAFGARLRASLADQSLEDSSSQQRPHSDRFSRWLAGVAMPPPQKEVIRAHLDAQLAAGDEGSLAAGSPFDLWLREHLAADALASWTANQNAHSADKIERRANRLLVGLQSALSLTSEHKDSIYPQLAKWAEENPQNILGNESQDAEEQEKSLAARVEQLSTLIPAEQHEALAEWVAEFLPTYCLEESD